MVSAQHAVPHPVVFKDFHCLVGNLPLVIHVPFIHQVACMDGIADIPILGIIHNPLVLLQIMMRPAFRIILGIGNPCEGKVVIFRTTGAVPTGCLTILRCCFRPAGLEVRIIVRPALHQQDGISTHHMILDRECCINIPLLIRTGQQLPLVGGQIKHIHG
ncbi:hypothetical protein D3C75_739410 [compost metagenome]